MKGDNNNLMMKKRRRQKKKKKMMEWSVKKDELEVAEILVDFVNLHAARLSLMPVLNLSRNLSCWAAGKRSVVHRRCVRRNLSDPFNLLLSSAGGLNYSKKSSSSSFPNQTPPPPPPPSSSCDFAAAITKVYSRKKGLSVGDYRAEENTNSTDDGYQFSSFNDYDRKSQEQKVVITIDRDEREEPEVAQIVEDEEHAPINVVPDDDDDQEPLIMDPTVSPQKGEQYHHDYKYGELRGLPSSPHFVEGDKVVILSDSDRNNHSEAVILISDSDRMGGAKPSKDSEVVILSESSTAKSSKQYSEVVGINRKDKAPPLCSNIPYFKVNLLKSPLSVN